MVLLTFPLLLLEALTGLVTALAPSPPAKTGLPMPNRSCVSFAFRVRVLGPATGWGASAGCDPSGGSSSSSLSEWMIIEDVDCWRGRGATVRVTLRLEGGRCEGAGSG